MRVYVHVCIDSMQYVLFDLYRRRPGKVELLWFQFCRLLFIACDFVSHDTFVYSY